MHESKWIRKRAVQNILNAYNFAEWRGEPLNIFVVLHLKDTISQSSDTAFKRLKGKFRSWLRYKRSKSETGTRPAFVFSHENPNDNPHVNCFFHIPENLVDEFQIKLRSWVRAVQGDLDDETLYCKVIAEEDGVNVARYLIKGVDPEHIDRFGLRRLCDRKGPQGIIFGQRAGFSRSLGPSAIKKAGFKPMQYYREQKRKQRKREDDDKP